MVVDIENSSGRPEYVRGRLQRDTHDVIGRALAEAGVKSGEFTLDERGDGALVTLPSDASKSRLTEVCLHSLPAQLRRLAVQHSEFGRLRLRVSLNAGDISRTDQGSWLGTAVDTAFRLVDAEATKAALAASKDAVNKPWDASTCSMRYAACLGDRLWTMVTREQNRVCVFCFFDLLRN